MIFSKALLKTKLKATGIHLSMSLVIFFILAYQIIYVWYPQPYFSIDGGWQGIRIVAAVDLALGPILTFLIFDLAKSRKALFFDLLVIATIQIGALIYGVVTTYEQRPVAVVLYGDFIIPAVAADYGDHLESLDELKYFSDETPPIIYADVPLERAVLDEIMRIKFEQKINEHAQIQLYQPKSGLISGLKNRQSNYLALIEDFGQNDHYQRWLKENNRDQTDVLVALFFGRYGRAWLIFDLEANYIGYFGF